MLLEFDRRLKRDPQDAYAAYTHKGMAHFAATGPDGVTCRLCKHWRDIVASHAYYSSGGKHGARLKPHPCKKFLAMTGSDGPPIPHNAAACKYFDESEKAPPIFDPRVR